MLEYIYEKIFLYKKSLVEKKSFSLGIIRKQYLKILKSAFDQKLIQILTGLRRVGKSTIALQLIQTLIEEKKLDPQHILFFSIEEPSLAKRPIIDIINEFRMEHKIKSVTNIY